MNFQLCFEKLRHSDEFKEFIKKYPSAFLCSAFFSIDKKGNDNKQHFDYFIGDKIISFQLEDNFKKIELENFGGQVPKKVNEKIDFDFKILERMIVDKMQEENIRKDIQKILWSLQRLDEGDFLIGTIFISGLGMVRVKINLKDNKLVDFEKKSLFDIVKVFKNSKENSQN